MACYGTIHQVTMELMLCIKLLTASCPSEPHPSLSFHHLKWPSADEARVPTGQSAYLTPRLLFKMV